MPIHPTAIVEDGAAIDDSAVVGAFCCVGPKVKLGPRVVLHPHATVTGRTEIGEGTVVHSYALLGGPPQHLGYRGEDTGLVIGRNNIIREYVTMNIGTVAGGGVTRVGDDGFYMTACHVGHDCQVGDHVIMANCATLGGHVSVEEYVFLGGLCAIHQHSRIGAYAFIGGCAAVVADVIPYASAFGNHAALAGLNVIGMKRRGLPRETIRDLRAAYKLLFDNDRTFKERLEEASERYGARPEVKRILDFVRADARRPLMTPR
ncbi:MAG: acyl-ACP--UDP-N-acetylglucosamine O-acyltransferase [Alphaproteobacteria bacterium]|nr:acyl-ACP--UDP-N-acetylglucosamine O-acyltransferase [Alphaproteobacteria bacterium]